MSKSPSRTPKSPRRGTAPSQETVNLVSLAQAREAAKGCRSCHLWRIGTQTVFGEGKPGTPLMLVGEQPGDREDLVGRPFVGPAGHVLDQALAEAGIDR